MTSNIISFPRGCDPFAYGGRDPDRDILAAEEEFYRLESRANALREAGAPEPEHDAAFDAWTQVMDLICTTAPKTIAGCAAKLRVLLHEEVGLPSGESEHDMTCLRQIREFLSGADHPVPVVEDRSGETETPVAALFREWRDAVRRTAQWGRENARTEDDDDAFFEMVQENDAIAEKIGATPTIDAADVAIKAYLAIYYNEGASHEDPAAVCDMGDPQYVSTRIENAVLRDIARLLPEGNKLVSVRLGGSA